MNLVYLIGKQTVGGGHHGDDRGGERRCEVSRENLLDSDHKEAIHNSDGKLLGYLNRNGALVDPTQREVDQDRFDMDMWADGQRKQKRVTRDDDLAGVIESQERRDGK